MKSTVIRKQLTACWNRYKWVILILTAGFLVLLLPQDSGTQKVPEPSASAEVSGLTISEERLEQILSKISGAGTVHVALTFRSGTRTILAGDETSTQRDGLTETSRETVIVNQSDRSQKPVYLQQYSPQYQGALVVCSGGNDPYVRLHLTEAVSVLTGLSADRISVCKGK